MLRYGSVDSSSGIRARNSPCCNHPRDDDERQKLSTKLHETFVGLVSVKWEHFPLQFIFGREY